MKRRPAREGGDRLREALARRDRPASGEAGNGKEGRLDFLFDGRTTATPTPPPAAVDVVPALEPPPPPIDLTPRPWEAPPPAAFRCPDDEAPRDEILVTFAISLGPLRTAIEVAAIVFYGVVAAIHRRL